MEHKSKEEKANALARWARGDDPQLIAKELGVDRQTLKNWQAKAKEQNFIDTPKIGKKPSENVGAYEGQVHSLQKHPRELSPEYITTSIQESACLEMAGHEMIKMTELGAEGRKQFHFKNSAEVEEIAGSYRSGSLGGSYYHFTNKVFEILAKSKR